MTDLYDDAARFVAEALKGRKWVALDDLAENYTPPRPNNMADIQSEFKKAEGVRLTIAETKDRLIREAVDEINLGAREPIILRDDDTDAVRFADGVDPDSLTEGTGKPLIPPRELDDLFDPETGVFAGNIRAALDPKDAKDAKDAKDEEKADDELRWSMTTYGYWDDKPIIKDEHGVIIEGHRRDKISRELGLDPRVVVMSFGDGDAGTSGRLGRAIGSNFAKPFTPADRKFIAENLYGKPGWSLEKLAEKLRVSAMTVSRDLRGLTDVKPDPTKGGRPRRTQEQTGGAIRKLHHDEPELSRAAIARQLSTSAPTVKKVLEALEVEEREREATAAAAQQAEVACARADALAHDAAEIAKQIGESMPTPESEVTPEAGLDSVAETSDDDAIDDVIDDYDDDADQAEQAEVFDAVAHDLQLNASRVEHELRVRPVLLPPEEARKLSDRIGPAVAQLVLLQKALTVAS